MTWDEYCKVFINFGFELKSGNGSRRSFVDENNHVFHIHEPHPSSIMKPYTIKLAIEKFWYELFGYDFSKLTEWEARFIINSRKRADEVRDTILATKQN